MSNKILVLGSTGKTGSRIVTRLKSLNISFAAASRNAYPSFNWDDASNWHKVINGADIVYITFQPDLAVPQSTEKISLFVEKAKQAGVKKLVLLSGRGEKEAELCEQIIMQSGLEWAIVRASWFMQNFSESFLLDGVLNNEMILPVIKAREPFIDLDDLADVAVKVLTDDTYSNQVYEITGPELLSFKQATELIADATTRNIAYTEMNIQEYASLLESFQLPADYIWLIQYLFSEILDGRNESVTDVVEKILNRKPCTFKQYVEKTIKSRVWKVQ